MRVDQLEGAALDLWTARAQGLDVSGLPIVEVRDRFGNWYGYAPSSNWSQGGPVVDRLMASGQWQIEPWADKLIHPDCKVVVTPGPTDLSRPDFFGPNVLIAACRALVFSVYGAEVPNAG